ncbi:endonuclease/exonuclease/phosphatase family protein [Kineococcus gynurae]|uniref:Endonuclease/exonuclease/phosphatase family protein n=1 Tax=Kineococcus gynurae TaxID=452979 RepID=A0ABV5LTV5_9ACTN
MRAAIRVLCGAYGLLATLAVLLVAVLGDRSAISYTAGLLAFWWLLPAPGAALLLAATFLGRPESGAPDRVRHRTRGRRRRRRGLVPATTLLLPVLAAGWLLGPYVVPGRGSDAPADLVVGAFNTSGGAGLRALADISAGPERPDVWLLQEVTVWTRPVVDERLGGEYPYRVYSPDENEVDGWAVLSRYPVLSSEPVTGLPEGSRGAGLVTLDVDGREVDVVSIHLASPCLGCAGDAVERNPAGRTGDAARVRVEEARRLAELSRAADARGRPVVIGGDLNSSDLNQPLRILTGGVLDTGAGDGGLVDTHRAVGNRPQLTRGQNPGFARVDVLLVAGLEPLRDAEGWAGRSTHSPVIGWYAWA